MSKCWKIECNDCNGEYKIQYVCADTVVTNTNTTVAYNRCQIGSRFLLTIDGVSQDAATWTMANISSITQVADSSYRPPGVTVYGNCDSCKPSTYDCINGVCTVKTQYNTPGLYNSLSDCQAVCANGGSCGDGKQCIDPTNFCPPGKICIDQGEFSSIEALISKIGSEVC